MSSVFTTTFYSDIALGGLKNSILNAPAYIFAGNGTREQLPIDYQTNDSVLDHNQVVKEIIFGKKIMPLNIYDMVKKYQWQSGTVYRSYDHRSGDLAEVPFYVLASNRAVYKCLSNANGVASTVEPSSLSTAIFTTADGYQWKYMYRLSVNDINNLTTNTLMPSISDANTVSSAIAGSIDVYDVTTGGAGYTAVNSGTIREVVSSTILKLATDNIPFDGALNGSAILITSGPGAGQISIITEYSSNSSGRFATLASPFTGVTLTSQYRVAPYVSIVGDGSGAKGICNVSNNQVVGVQVAARGSGYTWATATVAANTAYGQGAQIVPIIPPVGGHGSDVTRELFSREILIHADVVGDEGGTIPSVPFTYGAYGIITDVRQSSNTAVSYTANTFNNTVQLDTVQVGGVLQKGDTITSDDPANSAKIVVIHANNNTIHGVYQTKKTIELFDTFKADRGITGVVTTVSQPNVYCHDGALLCFEDINTISHSGTTETINIILRY